MSAFENGLSTENRVDHAAPQRAAHVRTLPVAIKQIRGAHGIFLTKIHEGKIGIRADGEAAFGFGEIETLGDVELG